MAHPRDRASVTTTAVLQIVETALRAWLHGARDAGVAAARHQIENLLREEFDQIARQVQKEIGSA
jgi:hypothetical protein